MITNALMNNSEFPPHQRKSNLELSAAESGFSRNQEVPWIPLLPSLLPATPPCLSAQTWFWDLAKD